MATLVALNRRIKLYIFTPLVFILFLYILVPHIINYAFKDVDLFPQSTEPDLNFLSNSTGITWSSNNHYQLIYEDFKGECCEVSFSIPVKDASILIQSHKFIKISSLEMLKSYKIENMSEEASWYIYRNHTNFNDCQVIINSISGNGLIIIAGGS